MAGRPLYPDDWATRISALEQRVKELHTAATSRVPYGRINGDLTIRGGTLRILNANGVPTVEVGALSDGTDGVAAIDPATGDLVKLSTLAFGIRGASVATFEGTTSTAWVDLATPGPSVTVDIGPARRCIVILSCLMNGAQGGLMGVQISGATTRSPTNAGIVAESDSGGVYFSGSNALLVTGLNPGSNTFTAKYSAFVTSPAVSFGNRHLIVIPY